MSSPVEVWGKTLTPYSSHREGLCLIGIYPMKMNIEAAWLSASDSDRWIPVSREFKPHQRPPLFP